MSSRFTDALAWKYAGTQTSKLDEKTLVEKEVVTHQSNTGTELRKILMGSRACSKENNRDSRSLERRVVNTNVRKETSMMKKALYAFGVTVLLSGFLAVAASGAVGTKADIADGKRLDNVSNFNLGQYPIEYREALVDRESPYGDGMSAAPRPRSVGSALSPNTESPGVSIDLTWNDVQNCWNRGRQVAHWWNGDYGEGVEVSVHIAYYDMPDSVVGFPI